MFLPAVIFSQKLVGKHKSRMEFVIFEVKLKIKIFMKFIMPILITIGLSIDKLVFGL